MCKFFQFEVQIMDGLLTRPVTADQSHDDAGNSEREQDDECGLHMIRVP